MHSENTPVTRKPSLNERMRDNIVRSLTRARVHTQAADDFRKMGQIGMAETYELLARMDEADVVFYTKWALSEGKYLQWKALLEASWETAKVVA
jgi:hypothetical protein